MRHQRIKQVTMCITMILLMASASACSGVIALPEGMTVNGTAIPAGEYAVSITKAETSAPTQTATSTDTPTPTIPPTPAPTATPTPTNTPTATPMPTGIPTIRTTPTAPAAPTTTTPLSYTSTAAPVSACVVIHDYQLKDLPEVATSSGNYLHVEYWIGGSFPEYETILPGGRYLLKINFSGGHVWEYAGCTFDQVFEQVKAHIGRRLAQNANNGGYVYWEATGFFKPVR
ncbi:MAG: hypothetical protein QHH09_02450 [Microgenomates group bacterium]|nr:hypothetical protein [Microgenomates group bacterium]